MSTSATFQVRPKAARALLDWLRVESEKHGVVEEVSWDDPDMFMVHIRLDHRLMAAVWMDATEHGYGYEVTGHFAISDALEVGPDFYARRSVQKRRVSNDYVSVTDTMRSGFVHLFAALDKVPR